MTESIFLASANKDKVIEIRELMPGIELRSRPDEVPDVDETGETLLENARLKARAIVEATGMPALADDTGLEVDALDGRPGVRSARYAGENVTYADNVNKLLAELKDVPSHRRTARFRTIALLLYPDGTELVAEGVVAGRIAPEPAGDGWGYDPVFVADESGGRTFAEMSRAEKQAISHRGRAFRELRRRLD